MKGLNKIILLALVASACTRSYVTHVAVSTPIPSQTTLAPPTAISTLAETPTSIPSPTASCGEDAGRMESIQYPAFLVEGEIPLRIYLPRCYDSSGERYPVFYLLHGYPMNESQWDELGVDELVDEGIREGRWQPFIMVMTRIPRSLNVETDGGPGSYEEEMMEGLVPFIDEHFRTLDDAGCRAIAGISRGAIWAMEIGFLHPDKIDLVAVLSPALPMNRARPEYDPYEILRSGRQLPTKIFVSVGEAEMGFRIKTEELVELMDELGIPHTFVLTKGAHEASTWSSVLEDLIIFISNAWRRPIGD